MIEDFVRWLGGTGPALHIQASTWLFPALEAIHVIAIASVVGVIAIMDLRLLGLTSRSARVTQVARDTLPWVWGAFFVAVVTGALMFISSAEAYYANTAFRFKMLLIVLAGVNMLIFEIFTIRSVEQWDHTIAVPRAGKIAATLSLLFWIGVIFLGRWIGFTLDQFSTSDLSSYVTTLP